MEKKNVILAVGVILLAFLGVFLMWNVWKSTPQEEKEASQTNEAAEEKNARKEEEASFTVRYQLQEQNQEMGFWESDAAAKLGILEENSLNYEIEKDGQYGLEGIVSSQNFRLDGRDYRLIVRMTRSEDKGSRPVLEIYDNQSPYDVVGSQFFDEECFSDISVLEERLGIFLREGSKGMQIVSFHGVSRAAEGVVSYQILSFDGTALQVEWQYEGERGSEETEKELEGQELRSKDFLPETLVENQGICYLTNTRESQEGSILKYRGSMGDYTELRENLESYDRNLYQGMIRAGVGGSKRAIGEYQKTVPDDQVEEEVLAVRAVFTEQMENCDNGVYQPLDLGNGMTAWLSGQQVCVVMTNASLVTDTNEKIFDYQDGKLIFAYHNEGGLQHRIYYKDENPFRWSYPTSADIRDNAFEDSSFISESRKYQQEGYEYYDMAMEMLGQP